MKQIALLAAAAALSFAAACGEPPEVEAGEISTVAGNGSAAFDGDGLPATECGLYAPIQAVIDRDDRARIVDWNNHRVRQLRDDGTLDTVLGTGVELPGPVNDLARNFSIHHPFQFQQLEDGRLYFAGYHDPRAFFVDASDRVRVVAGFGPSGDYGDGGPAQLAAFFAPAGIAVAEDGTVFIADELSNRIRRVSPDETIHAYAGSSEAGYEGDGGPAIDAKFNGPTRLAIDLHGDLIVCDTKNHALRKIDASGIITTIAGDGRPGFSGDGGPAALAQLNEPYDVEIMPDGSMLVADAKNHVIRRIRADGTIETVAGTPGVAGFSGDGGRFADAQLNFPLGIDRDRQGNLWIADTNNQRVRKVAAGSLKP